MPKVLCVNGSGGTETYEMAGNVSVFSTKLHTNGHL